MLQGMGGLGNGIYGRANQIVWVINQLNNVEQDSYLFCKIGLIY